MKKFSVVVSVYHRDDPKHLSNAINSLIDQTLLPSEIIVSVDGPIGLELEMKLNEFEKKNVIKLFRLEKNSGLAQARNLAISKCKFPLVAVMDADDICPKNRFEKQVKAFLENDVDVVGGLIEEFVLEPGDQKIIRSVPTTHDEICKFVKWRNPVNHVSIMFKKEALEKVGGYKAIRYSEDWDLIVRLLSKGTKIMNLNSTLVHVRGGNSMYGRRSQLGQVLQDLAILKNIRKLKMSNHLEFWIASLSRLLFLAVPQPLLGLLYKNYLRKNL